LFEIEKLHQPPRERGFPKEKEYCPHGHKPSKLGWVQFFPQDVRGGSKNPPFKQTLKGGKTRARLNRKEYQLFENRAPPPKTFPKMVKKKGTDLPLKKKNPEPEARGGKKPPTRTRKMEKKKKGPRFGFMDFPGKGEKPPRKR